ncbi:zinc-binding dehydrogenase [Streptomyces bobili]|uniref:zinc-binding dehydrogenase n=1 Tax=Streptomyces bobili TaxID=67280 RepID=UPI003430FBFF
MWHDSTSRSAKSADRPRHRQDSAKGARIHASVRPELRDTRPHTQASPPPIRELSPVADAGKFPVPVEHALPLAEAAEAWRLSEAGRTHRRIVLTSVAGVGGCLPQRFRACWAPHQ